MDRLDELDILVAIVETGSLAGAARRLGRSAPAVTRGLAALEKRAGLCLVERTTRRLAPTDAGRDLAEQARRLIADYEASVSAAAAAPLRGLLRVTAPVVEHVSKELKAGSFHQVRKPRFVRVELQSSRFDQLPELSQRGFGLFPRAAEHDHVVGIAHEPVARFPHRRIDRV